MQSAIYQFFVQHIIKQDEHEELMRTFKQLDLNNDGVLSRDELLKGFQQSMIFIT